MMGVAQISGVGGQGWGTFYKVYTFFINVCDIKHITFYYKVTEISRCTFFIESGIVTH